MRLQAVILSGAARSIERQQLFFEYNAWSAARLGATGYHDPKKFPAFEKVRTKSGARRARPDWRAMKAMVMAHVAASGGEIKKRE